MSVHELPPKRPNPTLLHLARSQRLIGREYNGPHETDPTDAAPKLPPRKNARAIVKRGRLKDLRMIGVRACGNLPRHDDLTIRQARGASTCLKVRIVVAGKRLGQDPEILNDVVSWIR